MRILLDRPAAVGKLLPAGDRGIHQPIAAAQSFGLRGLAAGLWRAPDERGGRASTFELSAFRDYIAVMKRFLASLLATAIVATPVPAFAAGAGSFTLVNRTGANIGALEIRRVGTAGWKSIGGTAANGGRAAVAFADPDCAFDIKANLAGGGSAIFPGVNLCDVTTVTLNRSSSGALWVDYD